MPQLTIKVFATALCLFSASSLAENTVVECNDCSAQQKTEALSEQKAGIVFIADFVNKKLNKFVISDNHQINQAQLTLGETLRINQQFDYRKTELIASNL